MDTLFVYGSLLTIAGHPMHNYMRGFCDYLGDATVGGVKIDLGACPGLLPSGDPDERVSGELFRIHDEMSETLFKVLDHYMGCSNGDSVGDSEEDSGFGSDLVSEPSEFFRHRQNVILLGEPSACKEHPSENQEQQTYNAWVYLSNS